MDREELIIKLGHELGKSITKQLLINEKYTQYKFNNVELNSLVGHMFNKIHDELNE